MTGSDGMVGSNIKQSVESLVSLTSVKPLDEAATEIAVSGGNN